ncbi:cupin domain-containing protein [Geomonas nitrogeniifigens]|uniref:phosphate acyltransferase n=1 Tax=Geomonas diazotrophica TaxID=2843197 RepID=UPI001C2CB293|nr:phosphate acyltransferase [Geomonas nitrogeniifigens]QXE87687.1 cupin domain-containing protein [Geomonas nitrogeniifigens]
MKIGPNLRAVVAAKGVPMDEVREALGWDRETLDRVLADRLSPGISELLRLATFLGVGISRLLGGDQESGRRAVKTGKDERVGVDRRNALHYESLAQAFAGRHLEPFVVDLYRAPETEPDLSRHPGEEFLFVLSGELEVTVDGEPFHLEEGDSLYFDSLLPHVLVSLSEHTRLMAVLYRGESMLQLTKGHGMKSLIEAARLAPRQNVVLVCPDPCSLKAVNKGIEEGILETAFLVGDPVQVRASCADLMIFEKQYRFVTVPAGADHEREAALAGVELVAGRQGDLLMKGGINTAVLMKAVLAKKTGIGTGRRLSNVSIFELPGVERLIFLTDPAINPELFAHQEAASAIDIIENAIHVARALGVERPKVALLEANEVPSANIPTTLLEQELSRRQWPQADVYGPLSYDLALYPESVRKKGLTGNPVAGQADIIVVPHISGGNFLYKSWVFTMGAEVANVVLGARAPIILTSRSDSDLTKFLTICASSLYGHYLRREG